MNQNLTTEQLEEYMLQSGSKLFEDYRKYDHGLDKSMDYVSIRKGLPFMNQFIDVKGNLKPTYFDFLLRSIPKSDINKQSFSINSRSDMYNAIQKINDELPTSIRFTSSKLSQIKIKKMYIEVLETFTGSRLKNLNSLANYREDMVRSRRFVLVDCSHKNRSAHDIQIALNVFTKALTKCLYDEDIEQFIINLYDYIFENFNYNANSYSDMIVGNLGSGELACNGISRLVSETLMQLGLKNELRQGISHFWNVIYLGKEEITFDVTTDILLNKKYLTLGNSSIQHIKNTESVGFYSADFYHYVYKIVNEYKFKKSRNRFRYEEQNKGAVN